jgi:Sulfotransferase domain
MYGGTPKAHSGVCCARRSLVNVQVVGAGLGRTGTHSLKVALEQLLGGPCYHMVEIFGRPDQRDTWAAAVSGEDVDWATFLAPYRATVDWPAAAFWEELSAAAPDAVVLLSTRDADAWWQSASQTIFAVLARGARPDDDGGLEELAMITDLMAQRFTPDWRDRASAIAAYEAHNARVRAQVPASRLVEWHPGDGWGPLCAALGVEEPGEPFPHLNSTSDFRALTGLDGSL